MDGFDLDVVDYLLKPVSLDRFVKACSKAHELFQVRSRPAETATLPHPGFIFIPCDYSLIKVNFIDIVWIEGLKDYVRIHLVKIQKPIVTRMKLKTLEDQLPSTEFIRIHKSYIISVRHMTAIRKNSLFIREKELPIGNNYRNRLILLTGRQE